MNWKHMICLNLDQKRSIDEIHRRALDIKSHMQDCDDYTPLKLLEEQAMKAVVMCDECQKKLR